MKYIYAITLSLYFLLFFKRFITLQYLGNAYVQGEHAHNRFVSCENFKTTDVLISKITYAELSKLNLNVT